MRKIFVLFLLGLCVCLVGGCCNGNGTTPDEPDTPEPPANNVTYLTWDRFRYDLYVTRQPIKEVDDYIWVEPGTGEYSSSGYYLSTMGVTIPYGTRWSDGSVTLSIYPFEGVSYTHHDMIPAFLEFNDTSFVSNGSANGEAEGTEGDVWLAGTAPNGRTESDYTYDSEGEKYVYNSGNSSTNTQQVTDQTPSASSALPDEDSDDEDVNGNVSENDGRNLNTNR